MDKKTPQEINNMIQLLSSRMHSAVISYYFWKWLEQARNPNIGEKKAKRNLEIMNRQKNFFHTVIRSSFYSFVVDLCVFFDRQQPALSIDKIIPFVNLSEKDKAEINRIREEQKNNVKNLKDIRDKEVAHLDLDVDRSENKRVIYKEIEDLFNAVQEIFNIITNSFDRSIWSWNRFDNEVEHEMSWLFGNLEKGEQKRLDEINKKYKIYEKRKY